MMGYTDWSLSALYAMVPTRMMQIIFFLMMSYAVEAYMCTFIYLYCCFKYWTRRGRNVWPPPRSLCKAFVFCACYTVYLLFNLEQIFETLRRKRHGLPLLSDENSFSGRTSTSEESWETYVQESIFNSILSYFVFLCFPMFWNLRDRMFSNEFLHNRSPFTSEPRVAVMFSD